MVSERSEERSEAQAIEGYGCICGFKTDDKKEMTNHLLFAGRRDGKGVHKSLGRINLQTGEVIVPPWSERNDAQKSETRYARKSGGRTQKSDEERPVKQTGVLANAQELRFVPRIYTTDYSPIIRAAQDAAVEFWGWPKDMTLGDFLDTALHFLFMEHGITLAGYTISDEAREAIEAKHKAQEAQEIKELQEVAK